MLSDVRTLQAVALPVNEIYASIQGEARWTGTPAWFVRTQGCPVGCPWCDTKYTWTLDSEKARPMLAVVNKGKSDATWADIDVDRMLGIMATKPSIRHIVITGGEPCLNRGLRDVTGLLVLAGFTVQIETSGTFPIEVHDDTWVTCSPKIGMPGGRAIIAESVHRADEIKFPVGKEMDVHLLQEAVIPSMRKGALIWLQPISQSKKATALCVEMALKHGYRVSAQVHKFLDLP